MKQSSFSYNISEVQWDGWFVLLSSVLLGQPFDSTAHAPSLSISVHSIPVRRIPFSQAVVELGLGRDEDAFPYGPITKAAAATAF